MRREIKGWICGLRITPAYESETGRAVRGFNVASYDLDSVVRPEVALSWDDGTPEPEKEKPAAIECEGKVSDVRTGLDRDNCAFTTFEVSVPGWRYEITRGDLVRLTLVKPKPPKYLVVIVTKTKKMIQHILEGKPETVIVEEVKE